MTDITDAELAFSSGLYMEEDAVLRQLKIMNEKEGDRLSETALKRKVIKICMYESDAHLIRDSQHASRRDRPARHKCGSLIFSIDPEDSDEDEEEKKAKLSPLEVLLHLLERFRTHSVVTRKLYRKKWENFTRRRFETFESCWMRYQQTQAECLKFKVNLGEPDEKALHFFKAMGISSDQATKMLEKDGYAIPKTEEALKNMIIRYMKEAQLREAGEHNILTAGGINAVIRP